MPIHLLSLTTFLLLVLGLNSVQTQKKSLNLKRIPCDSLAKTKAWQKTHKELSDEFNRLFEPVKRNKIASSQKSSVLEAITSSSEFEPLFEARYWMSNSVENAKSMIPNLIELLTDSKLVGLTNSADVIIPERIQSKDLEFYGHGWTIEDDLFQVSGRASWLLKEITGENFGDVKPTSSISDLTKLQGQWANWYNGFDCK